MGCQALQRLFVSSGAQIMLPKVIPVNGNLMIDMHGDGKLVANLTRNEAYALFQQMVILLEPRDHSAPVDDA